MIIMIMIMLMIIVIIINFMTNSYPYAGTINFKICLDVQPQHTNLRCRTLLTLQLGLIGISDVGVVKQNIPLLDSERNSED